MDIRKLLHVQNHLLFHKVKNQHRRFSSNQASSAEPRWHSFPCMWAKGAVSQHGNSVGGLVGRVVGGVGWLAG